MTLAQHHILGILLFWQHALKKDVSHESIAFPDCTRNSLWILSGPGALPNLSCLIAEYFLDGEVHNKMFMFWQGVRSEVGTFL